MDRFARILSKSGSSIGCGWKRAGRVLVTSNGKPKAIMIPTSEGTFASDLELLDRVDLARAIGAIRREAVIKGTDSLTMKEIDAEVAAVRAARKR